MRKRILLICSVLGTFIGPSLLLLKIKQAGADAAWPLMHRFPYVTTHHPHIAWMARETFCAALFFLILALLGFAAPWRAGLRGSRTMFLVLSCWLLSFLFGPHVQLGQPLPAMDQWLIRNLSLSLICTALWIAYWSRRQDKAPTWMVMIMGIPLFMSVHALTSFFYVFTSR